MNIVSINMSINNGDVERRYADFTDMMLAASPELIMVQEVSSDVGKCALQGLVQRLGSDYTMRYETVYPGQKNKQGIAVVTSLPLKSSRATQLPYGGPQTQIVEIGGRYETLVAVNTHLEAAPKHEVRRIKKLNELEEQLDERYGQAPRIVAGDFNALPFFPSILAMKNRHRYTSAYKTIHGAEPRFTFPAFTYDELLNGRYVKKDQLEKLAHFGKILRAVKGCSGELPRYTTDYVFLKGVRASGANAKLVTAKDRTSRPVSDHYGLSVVLPSLRTI